MTKAVKVVVFRCVFMMAYLFWLPDIVFKCARETKPRQTKRSKKLRISAIAADEPPWYIELHGSFIVFDL